MNITIVGCGVMGSAFAKHFAKKHSVTVCDHDLHRMQALAGEIGGKYQGNVHEAVQDADVILLAVKPKDLASVAKSMTFDKEKILISILAGTPLSALKSHFPKAVIVRSMPNLALTCGQGVIGLVEDYDLSDDVKKKVDSLMQGMGLYAWMPENKVEALTALSGSGIAFVLLMIEAMIDGGVFLGFSAQESREFVLKTMDGAVALMREHGKHPAELKQQISSPAGTTIAGLKVMEEKGVRSGIFHTLIASYEKALSMKQTS